MTSAASNADAVESGWSMVSDVAVLLHKIRMGHVDILDVFLALWIITAVFTYLGFTLYDRLKERRRTDSSKLNQTSQVVIETPILSASTSHQYHQHFVADHGGHWANNVASPQGVRGAGSTSDWVNSVVQWIYSQQSQYTPQQVTASWLKALNDEAKRQGSSVQVTFEAMILGPTPPRFSNITVETEPKNIMTVTCDLEAEGVDFGVFASQQTATTVKLTNCNATVQKLSGKVQCIIRTFGEDWHITATLEEDTVLHLKITPQITQNENVDIHAMEEIIRNAILSATFTSVIPTRALPRDMLGLAWSRHKPTTTHSLPRTTTANHVPTKPHTAQEPRLLVKVIKANNLQRHSTEAEGDPYCVVTLDNPLQRHRTKFIKGSTNPFWDEQFLFQIGKQSREMTFEIHDKGNHDRFQGGTTIPLASIDRSRGSRHIIQLQSRPGQNDNVTGSIVLFLLFMQTPDTLKKPASPSRKIEKKQMQTPDGTIITTVTTKTSRPKHLGAGNNNDIPTKVYTHSVNGAMTPGTPSDPEGYWTPTCATTDFIVPDEVTPESGPDSSKSAVADTAIRHFQEQANAEKTPTKKSTLIIHGVSESPTDDYSNLQDAPEPISRNDNSRASRRRFLFFGRRKSKDGGKGGSRSSSFDESSLSSKSPEPQLRRAKTIDIPDSDEVSTSTAASGPTEPTPNKKKRKRFLGFMRRKKPKDRQYHSSINLKAEPDEGTVSDTPITREKSGNTLKVPASNQYTRSASTGDIKYERYLTVESFRQPAVVYPSGPSGSQTSVDRLSYTESNV